MPLTIFTPAPALQPYIKCYYVSDGNYPGYIKDVFFADGCLEIVFHAGLDFYRGEEKEYWAKAIGQITQPLTMRATGNGRTFGIWFLPHGFSGFYPGALSELNDKVLPLDNVFSQNFLDAVKNYLLDGDTQTLITCTDNYLLKKLQSPANPLKEKIVAHAVKYITNEKAGASLDVLVKDCNISNRYLQKIFLEKVGFSPKFFIKIARFQYALNHLINDENASLTSLAYDAGYYDQAHFINDFKQFTGFAPSRFQPALHPINQPFLSM
jgi:AraC-like DNA-binding protein